MTTAIPTAVTVTRDVTVTMPNLVDVTQPCYTVGREEETRRKRREEGSKSSTVKAHRTLTWKVW